MYLQLLHTCCLLFHARMQLVVSCHDAARLAVVPLLLWSFHWLGDVLVPGWILEGLHTWQDLP
jgi:hypothetical protein